MARVFTIAPGLENMGGLKTGGQGSVYKGRRTGEIITAIKILPAPVFSESGDDKNYAAFQNEVAKLKKVNEIPNPHVVKMLGSGISETGNFPFIEMEYIEGPDLEELLQSPNDPIFTITETLKVAEQLAAAIAHCHKMDVRHGDIKSDNVKFNSGTGNYILLDFGLAMMSDEQRRSNLLQAGKIEFMAPEQNTGQMLFQTDVYSYGVILFALLTGTVPFMLRGNGESARNEVKLAHMVAPVPDLVELRRLSLPAGWDNKKKQHEMQVPGWLVSLICKCLEKKPERRFTNGSELHNHILQKLFSITDNTFSINAAPDYQQLNQSLLINHEELKNQLSGYRQGLIEKEGELRNLQELLRDKEYGTQSIKSSFVKTGKALSKTKAFSRTSFAALLLIDFALAAFVMLPVFKSKTAADAPSNLYQKEKNTKTTAVSGSGEPAAVYADKKKPEEQQTQIEPERKSQTADEPAEKSDRQETGKQSGTERTFEKPAEIAAEENAAQEKPVVQISPEQKPAVETPAEQRNEEQVKQPAENESLPKKTDKAVEEKNQNTASLKNGVLKKYLVVSKAYFYNEADENTKRDEFISPFEKAVVLALNERYGFINVVITNPQGQVFKGWLRKRDLTLYSIE